MTRPFLQNGFGLTPVEANELISSFEQRFSLAPDNRETYEAWRALVIKHQISGAQVHDAKLVASAIVHAIPALLTFNLRDFRRFDSIAIYSPADLSG